MTEEQQPSGDREREKLDELRKLLPQLEKAAESKPGDRIQDVLSQLAS